MTKPYQTYLVPPPIDPTQITASTELRYVLIDTLQTLLQQTNHILITPSKPTLDPETFLNNLKTHPNVYQASLSRQFAADFSPDIEQTTLKDEPKDWYIKTADFGDTHDRPLQHRSGEYTQLLEDIEHYHQIFQQNCDRIIVLSSSDYSGYDTLINAAMCCLNHSPAQFQFIVVQPIQLYAFHAPSQKIHPIPALPTEELLQSIGMDALRWYSFRVPFHQIAPLNLSTIGQPNDSLYQVQSAHFQCCALLETAHQQSMIQLDKSHPSQWVIQSPTPNWADSTWQSPFANELVNQLNAIPEILNRCAQQATLDLIILHLEAISNTCHQWLQTIALTPKVCALLLALKNTVSDLLVTLLGITAPEPTPIPA